ncbi:hypothetical protein CRM76_00520 [Edwardsiella tarda]|uniref:Uncharacterized protein n=1 Tax=Edwardsiella tarda TaxID=636 RepID=A0A2A7U7V9_EDWTA|nr:hypothetical protein CRM76_00520 [Edwardsiella tarda]
MTLYTRIKHVARKTICFSCFIEVHEKKLSAHSSKNIFSTNWRYHPTSQAIKGR